MSKVTLACKSRRLHHAFTRDICSSAHHPSLLSCSLFPLSIFEDQTANSLDSYLTTDTRRTRLEEAAQVHYAGRSHRPCTAERRPFHNRGVKAVRWLWPIQTYLCCYQRYGHAEESLQLLTSSVTPCRRHFRRFPEGRCLRCWKVIQHILWKRWLKGTWDVKSKTRGCSGGLQQPRREKFECFEWLACILLVSQFYRLTGLFIDWRQKTV